MMFQSARPALKGGCTEKDFVGFAVLSTTRFPLKGVVSNHKGIFDERAGMYCPKRQMSLWAWGGNVYFASTAL